MKPTSAVLVIQVLFNNDYMFSGSDLTAVVSYRYH